MKLFYLIDTIVDIMFSWSEMASVHGHITAMTTTPEEEMFTGKFDVSMDSHNNENGKRI